MPPQTRRTDLVGRPSQNGCPQVTPRPWLAGHGRPRNGRHRCPAAAALRPLPCVRRHRFWRASVGIAAGRRAGAGGGSGGPAGAAAPGPGMGR